jgi:hypothetical protein
MTGTRTVISITCGLMLLYAIFAMVGSAGLLVGQKGGAQAVGGWIAVLAFLSCSIPGILALPTWKPQSFFRRFGLAANGLLLAIVAIAGVVSLLIFSAGAAKEPTTILTGLIVCSVLGFISLGATLSLARLGRLIARRADPNFTTSVAPEWMCLVAGLAIFGTTTGLSIREGVRPGGCPAPLQRPGSRTSTTPSAPLQDPGHASPPRTRLSHLRWIIAATTSRS